jgi:hypothetical protein
VDARSRASPFAHLPHASLGNCARRQARALVPFRIVLPPTWCALPLDVGESNRRQQAGRDGNKLGNKRLNSCRKNCQKRSAGESPETELGRRTLFRHPLLDFLSRLLSISGVSLLADDHLMGTSAHCPLGTGVVIMHAKAISAMFCILILLALDLPDRSNA